MEEPQRPGKTDFVYTEADVGHPELFLALRQWRTDTAVAAGVAPYQVLHQKTLIQIAVHLPDSIKNLHTIKGIGQRLAERYGEAIVALVAGYRKKHGIEAVILPSPAVAIGPTGEPRKTGKKEDTKTVSLEMLRGGCTIPEIAAQRGLSVQTVEGHLAYFVKNGTLAIDGLLPADRLGYLEEKMARLDTGSLKGLKTALGEEFSYGEINLVLAHLQHRHGHS
jgi:hypothetical protein